MRGWEESGDVGSTCFLVGFLGGGGVGAGILAVKNRGKNKVAFFLFLQILIMTSTTASTMPATSYIFFSMCHNSLRGGGWYYLCSTHEKTVWEILNNLPKVTRLISSRAEIWTQGFLTPRQATSPPIFLQPMVELTGALETISHFPAEIEGPEVCTESPRGTGQVGGRCGG